MSLVKRVNTICERFPYITQGLVSAVLQVVGDVIAQKVIEEKENIDYKRCANFFFLGYLTGLLLRNWYGVLERRITFTKPFPNALTKVAGKLKVQFIFSFL